MAKRMGVRAILLVEDEYLERFARNVLLRLGFGRREMRVCAFPVGKNAKQWVTMQYPEEVRIHRRKATHQQVALLVGTDADEQSVAQRQAALAASLGTAGLAARPAKEHIVLWIPKRHVETWILFLSGEQVTENQSYKHAVHDPDFVEVSRRFVEALRNFRQNLVKDILPSLAVAFRETERLDT